MLWGHIPRTISRNCYRLTFLISNHPVWNYYRSIASAQKLTSSDGCLVLQVHILPTQWTRHNLRCRLAFSASHSTASLSLPALWRARPLCCRSPSYHTLGCGNSAFVMAVISLLCSQVELRWNSTGSHCVPISKTLKEMCWVLKGWNEARGARTELALWGNIQRKHNGNNLVLQFPFMLFWTLVSAGHLVWLLFLFLKENSIVSLQFAFPFFASIWEKTQKLMRWQSWLCQRLGDPQGLLPTFLQVLGMQINFEMAAFRCDNYGFICKLSLPLILRDIKISSNAAIREDHICWCITDSKNMWFSRRQRSVNNHSFRQQCASETNCMQPHSRCLIENIYIFSLV